MWDVIVLIPDLFTFPFSFVCSCACAFAYACVYLCVFANFTKGENSNFRFSFVENENLPIKGLLLTR